MTFPQTICAVLMLGSLAGCAGVTTDVNARGGLPEPTQGTVNYRFAPSPVDGETGASSPAESMLRDGLATRGFVEGKPDAARYLVSVAWATRPAEVTAVTSGDCAEGCAPAGQPSFPWFGKPYVHTLTLRFFALPEGTEAYRVSVMKRDRKADAQRALPYLVASALARLPYAGAPQWRVQLREPGAAGDAAARAMPDVVSVKPVPQPQ
ncbi:DUF4136 domain-containing protein [Paraburkholderia adhaesiva]|uniref:DUF4136 domain-containing protein n=1 Tax=Paraburkholderia adhaesiva TaxID=2883244 RepID=UPI001F176B38|nr:DUF4136 domain-containing protein [Paraburkholderia adhaesiva]